MKRAIAAFEIEIEFASDRFDPEQNLQVAWYDPRTGTHHDYCDSFSSEPRTAERRASVEIAKGPFDRCETWLIEASIEYDAEVIDLEAAQLDVLEFDQEGGTLLETPQNATIRVSSSEIREKTRKKQAKRSVSSMPELLRQLLQSLETVLQTSPEITDTETREAMGEPVWCLFITPQAGYEMPDSFYLDSEQADRAVKKALQGYVDRAAALAQESGLTTFHDRLAAFQNADVSSDDGYVYDDFFGWVDPEDYDCDGNPKD